MKSQPINFAIPLNTRPHIGLSMQIRLIIMFINTGGMAGIIDPAVQYTIKRYPEIIQQAIDFRRRGQLICYF